MIILTILLSQIIKKAYYEILESCAITAIFIKTVIYYATIQYQGQ